MLTNISKSISGVLSSQGIEQKIDKAEEADKKNTDKLVKAMTDLTKHLKKIEKDSLKQEGKDRPTISKLLGHLSDTRKKFTSAAGITGMLADKVEHRPILGAIMGTVASKLDQRAEQKRKQENFVATVAAGTKFGRDIIGQKGEREGLKQISQLYKERSRIENLVEAKKAKQSELKQHGREAGIEVDLPEPELEDLKKWEDQLRKINDTIKEGLNPKIAERKESTPIKKEEMDSRDSSATEMTDKEADDLRKELLEGVKEGIAQGYEQLSQEEKDQLAKEDPEKIKGMLEGVEEEILNLSKAQLAELVKLNSQLEDASSKDKESEIESKIKQMNNAPSEKKEKTEEKKTFLGMLLDGAKALFGNPLKNLTGMLGKIMPMITGAVSSIGSLLSGLAPILGPVAGIAAAAGAGVMVGKGINAAVEQITGDSIGNHIYDTVDAIQGSSVGNLLGMQSDAQKRGDEQPSKSIGDHLYDAVDSVKGTTFANFLGYESDSQKLGIEKNVFAKPESLENQKLDKDIASADRIEKSDDRMERTTRAINDISDEIEHVKDKAIAPVAPVVVNSPKTINNSTHNIVRPQIRNPEPSYIKVDQQRFAF